MTSLLTPELRAMIGAVAHYPAREDIGGGAIRYFALAVGETESIHHDDEAGRAAGYPSRIAPATFVVDCAFYAAAAPSADGYIAHEWAFPGGPWRILRGGNDYTFERPVLPSDRIDVTFTLEAIEEKETRGGAQLRIVSLAQYVDADGAIVATNRETLFLQPREAAYA